MHQPYMAKKDSTKLAFTNNFSIGNIQVEPGNIIGYYIQNKIANHAWIEKLHEIACKKRCQEQYIMKIFAVSLELGWEANTPIATPPFPPSHN